MTEGKMPSTGRRIAAGVAGAAIAIVLAGTAIIANIAWQAERRYDAAAAAAIGAPTAGLRSLLAESLLAGGRPDQALAYARTAAQDRPMDVRALRVLGIVSERKGDIAGAGVLMTLAGRLGWRDTATQLWLLSATLQAGDKASAVQRADALARRLEAPQVTRAFFTFAIDDPDMRGLIAQRLAERPNWRGDFFAASQTLAPAQRPAFERLLGALDRSEAPVTRGELNAYVTGLVDGGDAGRGRAVWQRRVLRGATAGALFDGGFERATLADGMAGADAPVVFPFEWTVGGGGDGAATVDDGPDGGHVLHVEAAGLAGTGLAAQTVVLPQGRYRLTARLSADQGDLSSAVQWVIRCVPAKLVLPVVGVNAGIRLGVAFTVPAGCPAQRLELQTGGLGGAGVTGSIDDVALERIGS